MEVRRAAVAGSWYPGTEPELLREADGYLSAVGPSPSHGRVVGLVSPHAGLHYSGPVAAHAYARLQGRQHLTVVLVGPSHHAAFRGVAVYAQGAFETPLGRVEVDSDLALRLGELDPEIRHSAEVHADEHSLEMQLPFLQRVLGELRIVPLLMGSQRREEIAALAEALIGAVGERSGTEGDVVLVASSDLSHYLSSREAAQLDGLVVGDIASLDGEALLTRLERERGHACGGGAVVAVMRASRALGADRAEVLRYADSGDVPPHDKQRVVGYVSAAFVADA